MHNYTSTMYYPHIFFDSCLGGRSPVKYRVPQSKTPTAKSTPVAKSRSRASVPAKVNTCTTHNYIQYSYTSRISPALKSVVSLQLHSLLSQTVGKSSYPYIYLVVTIIILYLRDLNLSVIPGCTEHLLKSGVNNIFYICCVCVSSATFMYLIQP